MRHVCARGDWRGLEIEPCAGRLLRLALADRVVGMGRWGGGVDEGAVIIYPESVSRLRRLALADRVVGMGGWGGWRGSEYTAAPRVWIEAEATGKMSG